MTMNIKDYVASKGTKCPMCNGDALDHAEPQEYWPDVIKRVECRDCGAKWREAYGFSNISISDKGALHRMNLEQIKAALNAGEKVYWKSTLYEVIHDSKCGYLIKCNDNGNCIGLTWLDGTTLNGKESDFFVPNA